MVFTRYLIPAGSWLSLVLGLCALAFFAVLDDADYLTLAVSLFALSLSIKAYGNSRAPTRP